MKHKIPKEIEWADVERAFILLEEIKSKGV